MTGFSSTILFFLIECFVHVCYKKSIYFVRLHGHVSYEKSNAHKQTFTKRKT